jgi:hypothetical protein
MIVEKLEELLWPFRSSSAAVRIASWLTPSKRRTTGALHTVLVACLMAGKELGGRAVHLRQS